MKLPAVPITGLALWLVAGVAIGVVAPRLVPSPAVRRRWSLVFALLGALGGGLLATLLGFGGIASPDVRSVVIAALASLLSVLGAEVGAGR